MTGEELDEDTIMSLFEAAPRMHCCKFCPM
jgi:hypothetical protein